MDQDLPAQPRALIVDDEYLFALSLAEICRRIMRDLGRTLHCAERICPNALQSPLQ